VESELFGHEKGAFTGAISRRAGMFERANGGTIFLDEVGETSATMQVKLLRVLESGEILRVGGGQTIHVDVRVIAATNRDLEEAVEQGRFREDLYYRLSVFPIDVPPLRERGEDVVQLASHFLEKVCQDFGHRPLAFSRQQVELLKRYEWPGNVRELKNVIERAVILSRGKVLRLDLAMADILRPAAEPGESTKTVSARVMTEAELKSLQKQNMVMALELSDWRVSGPEGAAKLLGVKPTTLADRIRKHGIDRPRRRAAAS
jgi:transcriptional regulator with GAF, ATPase, and Fis domain